MACIISYYDFINGAMVQLPTESSAAKAAESDGHHGVRAILKPNAAAHALLSDHARLLVELARASRRH